MGRTVLNTYPMKFLSVVLFVATASILSLCLVIWSGNDQNLSGATAQTLPWMEYLPWGVIIINIPLFLFCWLVNFRERRNQESERQYLKESLKQASDKLEIREQHFRNFVDHATDALFIYDKSGKLIDVNQRACESLGYSRNELLQLMIQDTMKKFPLQRYQEAWKHRPEVLPFTTEVEHFRKDQSTYPAEIRLMQIESKGRAFTLVSSRDVTERKRSEEEKEKLEAQFHQAQKLDSIGRLAGGIAHDFNNILAVIMNYADFIAERTNGDEGLREDVSEIQNATKRAVELTQQLLVFSRKEVIEPKILCINKVISGMEKMLKRTIGEDVCLTVNQGSDLWRLYGDEGQIGQVVMNLSVNARDAMPTGGNLLIETTNVEIDHGYVARDIVLRSGKYVLVTVSDNGCGMVPEIKRCIFEPFFTTKEKGEGTGLGLSTVYGIIKQAEGYIEVESEPGVGTTFYLYFPATSKRVKRPYAVYRDYLVPGFNETILLVEDEPAVRRLTERILKNHGYKVLAAEHGYEAIEFLKKMNGSIDLLLTDVVMPQMSGTELATRVLKSFADTKVIYMSGYLDDTLTHNGVSQSKVTLIQKPFSESELLKRLRETLDRKC